MVEEFYSSPGPLVEKVVWSQPNPASFLRIAKTRYMVLWSVWKPEPRLFALTEPETYVMRSGYGSDSGSGFGSNMECKSQY